ncbi:Pkinase-domain-containing protein [Leucogyrophana mollusca]|uniref:Pkinase-domain-containing protein n=1 Tax=Leucogyrophana mollusca TaxID=85980 RepID=A0ACB8BQ14_9AGAM|nr:Pkinase-domain-containing protein [Leucogyrophana mollusca]
MSPRILGPSDYSPIKTLGVGSAGEVNLAVHDVTGEKVAVKIIPRTHNITSSSIMQPDHLTTSTEAITGQRSESSQEIRAFREAALSKFLHHPHICRLHELIVHPRYYYLVFEYVSCGSMLDYVIRHGRVREHVARKFARQIGSALNYCHRNNVVHRDLKLQDILISDTGDVKITDFGLSNVYSPAECLSTICSGSYFPAPELIHGKPYVGPAVDVWSFGIVLYTLVCGKVPFDGESIPALHAKIKRGLIVYPARLSTECKDLLSRMLATNPTLRATLMDVLEHPWMLRDFNGPPDSHLPHREPLCPNDLEPRIIKEMKAFGLGTEDEIKLDLVQALQADAYRHALEIWKCNERRCNESKRCSESSFNSNTSFTISEGPDPTPPKQNLTVPPPSKPSTRLSKYISHFLRFLSLFFSPRTTLPTPQTHNSMDRGSCVPMDPTLGFHPLISMYYLVREKLEREKSLAQAT